jgi:hypothetical protein
MNEIEIDGLTIAEIRNKIQTIRTMYKKEHYDCTYNYFGHNFKLK